MPLSTAGWIILIVFIAFVISLNLSLVFASRNKHREGSWVDQINKSRDTLNHPWQAEDEQFSKLASKVDELRNRDHLEHE
jgi:hypothetical protein